MTSTALDTIKELPEPVIRRGINQAQWRTLFTLYPGAKPESILLVWDYCVARRLDPLKKPCHIVPFKVKGEWRDVILPGIYELRTTAQRTGVYLGHSAPDYGPLEPYAGVGAPAWCAITFYRWNSDAGQRAEYPVRVLFREVVALGDNNKANARWSKAPVQMLTKCAEAAGLREAFPDEIGGEQTAEELDGQRAIDVQTVEAPPAPDPPDGYAEWLADMEAVAAEGIDKLEDAFAKSSEPCRMYLARVTPDAWQTLKERALARGGNQ